MDFENPSLNEACSIYLGVEAFVSSSRDVIVESNISDIIHRMFGDDYVSGSVANWYEFSNHRWNLIPLSRLRQEFSVALCDLFTSLANCADIDANLAFGVKKTQLTMCRYIFANTARESRDETFICAYHRNFVDDTFVGKLDQNTNIICFEDGVFDLKSSDFRPGRPDDYATMSNGLMWLDYDATHPIQEEIGVYLSQVFPDATIRAYVMKLFVSFLNGNKHEHKYYLWTGNGSNSKRSLLQLFESCMPDYCVRIPDSLVIVRRDSPSRSEQLSNCQEKRLVSVLEVDDSSTLDMINMRDMWDMESRSALVPGTESWFLPNFKLLLLCNGLPHVPCNRPRTWKRLQAVPFDSHFCVNPLDTNEFAHDYDLPSKMLRWPRFFMALLLHVHLPLFQAEGIITPQRVIEKTMMYRQECHERQICHERQERAIAEDEDDDTQI